MPTPGTPMPPLPGTGESSRVPRRRPSRVDLIPLRSRATGGRTSVMWSPGCCPGPRSGGAEQGQEAPSTGPARPRSSGDAEHPRTALGARQGPGLPRRAVGVQPPGGPRVRTGGQRTRGPAQARVGGRGPGQGARAPGGRPRPPPVLVRAPGTAGSRAPRPQERWEGAKDRRPRPGVPRPGGTGSAAAPPGGSGVVLPGAVPTPAPARGVRAALGAPRGGQRARSAPAWGPLMGVPVKRRPLAV